WGIALIPGKAAILEVETKSYEKESGDLLCMNRSTVYLRGAGGFSNSSKPFSYSNYPLNQTSTVKIPDSKPFSVFEDHTQASQALLYRLSGDYNPLHSDPMIAKVAGLVLSSCFLMKLQLDSLSPHSKMYSCMLVELGEREFSLLSALKLLFV
ncbi:enoyl-CoA hydratase 2, peroxisomal-like, partial [Lotus japonicus]|uniref:enoyl-CoA hydratase 2, peroxisomal-like n=1 Tax=Lotus japonicus TaxID=34305 RepID=UPI002588A9AD